jgi:AcrR family transcriptional regulator
MDRWGNGLNLLVLGAVEPPTAEEIAAGAELALAACSGDAREAERVVRGLLALAPSGPARRVLLALMRGLSPRAACGAAGIGAASLERTCAEHPGFAELVDAARSIGAARLEAVIEGAAANGDWKAASSLLRSTSQQVRPGFGGGVDPWAQVVAGWRPAEVRQTSEQRDAKRRSRARERARKRQVVVDGVVDGGGANSDSTESV